MFKHRIPGGRKYHCNFPNSRPYTTILRSPPASPNFSRQEVPGICPVSRIRVYQQTAVGIMFLWEVSCHSCSMADIALSRLPCTHFPLLIGMILSGTLVNCVHFKAPASRHRRSTSIQAGMTLFSELKFTWLFLNSDDSTCRAM